MIGRLVADRGALNPFGEKEDEVPARGRNPAALICTRVFAKVKRKSRINAARRRNQTFQLTRGVSVSRFTRPEQNVADELVRRREETRTSLVDVLRIPRGSVDRLAPPAMLVMLLCQPVRE